MEGDDYAMKMQMLIENEELQIHAFDAIPSQFHQASALGHRQLHQHLCRLLWERAEQDLRDNKLPNVGAVRFLRIPPRPPLQEVLNHFRGLSRHFRNSADASYLECRVDDAVWSYRRGVDESDLTRNALLIIVFATQEEARKADVVFGNDPWFRSSQASSMPL